MKRGRPTATGLEVTSKEGQVGGREGLSSKQPYLGSLGALLTLLEKLRRAEGTSQAAEVFPSK